MENLKIYWLFKPGGLESLKNLVHAIAGESRLKNLELSPKHGGRVDYRGDDILQHIITKHGKTLQVLKIPNMHPSLQVAGRTFGQTPNLKKIYIGITYSLKVSMMQLLFI